MYTNFMMNIVLFISGGAAFLILVSAAVMLSAMAYDTIRESFFNAGKEAKP